MNSSPHGRKAAQKCRTPKDNMRALHSTALICVLLLSGCANMRTSKSHYAGMDSMLAKADYPAAISQIENAKETSYSAKDRVVYYLDIGMLYHWNKEYEKSNEFLEQAERAIDDNFTKSLTRKASTLILNDNAQAYGGEDYEDIYVNAFKALNYLALGRNDEAFVEVRRINNKLLQLEDKHAKMARKLSEAEEAHEEFKPGKSHFQESALGRYLSMLLYRNELKWDDVRIDLEKIDKGWKLQPDIYTFDKPDFSRSTDRVFTPKARLNVIAFSGLAPDKKASTFSVYTEENVIILAGTSENYLGKQTFPDSAFFHGLAWNGLQFQIPTPPHAQAPLEGRPHGGGDFQRTNRKPAATRQPRKRGPRNLQHQETTDLSENRDPCGGERPCRPASHRPHDKEHGWRHGLPHPTGNDSGG